MKKNMFGVVAVLGAAVLAAGQVGATYAANVTSALGVNAGAGASGGAGAVSSVVSSTVGAGMNGSAGATGTVSVSAGVGLQAAMQSGTVTTSSDDAIVNLEGNTPALIQTDADLSAYGNLVVATRPAIRDVSLKNGDTVAVSYSQPAKFLGIFPASLTGEVDVDATGNATVHLPWYAFLYAKDTTNVQAAASTAVTQSGANFGDQAGTAADLADKARVMNAVSAALEAQAEADASVNVSTNTDANVNTQATGSVTGY